MSAIEVRNLSFFYGGKKILDDVTFSASVGEAWAVIGRNGVGKSTLLKCLCGLLRPLTRSRRQHQQNACVSVDGKNIINMTPREIALKIAYVPQGNNRIAPPFTVREYAMMARFPYKGFMTPPDKNDHERVDAALDVTGTASLAGRMMNTLSGGELQSALIAGAAAQETPILLLDEPTAYLDPYHRENIRQLIERLRARRGTAVVTVTHDVNLALSTHENILALIDGKVFFSGSKEEFRADAAAKLSKVFSVDFYEMDNRYGEMVYMTKGGAS